MTAPGSISYALAAGGLLVGPLTSGGFMSWGEPGPGRRITVYANAGHAFMVVDGRRYDTSALSGGGTRWTSEHAQHRGLRRPSSSGTVMRDIHARALDRLALARRETDRIADLVAATGLSRRAVQEALREPPYDPPADTGRALEAEHGRGVEGAGSRRPTAISTTSRPRAETAVARARFLHETYWLDGRT